MFYLISFEIRFINELTENKFHFQISVFGNSTRLVGTYPWLRWHQTFDVGYVPNNVVPKVFMAVALDLRDDPNGSVNIF